MVANVGTLIQPTTKTQYQTRTVPVPTSLFSHNDQQSTWQALSTEGARTGWGGRFADLVAGMNGSSTLFTAVSSAGNAVFLSGDQALQYQVSTNGAVGINSVKSTSGYVSSSVRSAMAQLVRFTVQVHEHAIAIAGDHDRHGPSVDVQRAAPVEAGFVQRYRRRFPERVGVQHPAAGRVASQPEIVFVAVEVECVAHRVPKLECRR